MAKQCRKQMNKAGVCVCPDCMRKRFPVWVEFWTIHFQVQKWDAARAEAWFQVAANQPWSVDDERRAA